MKAVTAVLKLLGVTLFTLVVAIALSFQISATPKYAKDTGKKCLDCHKKIPKAGDKDPQLTELGEKFKANDHKLPK